MKVVSSARGAIALAALVTVAAAASRPAAASEGIALEVVTETASHEASQVVLRELSALGFLSGAELARRLLAAHSRPGTELDPTALALARSQIEGAYEAYLRGDYPAAIAGADPGLSALLANPVTVARNQELRDDLFLGYVTLALAHAKKGEDALSSAAMQSLVRSFPDRELSYKRFGPQARELFLAAQRELERAGRGSVAIEVDDPDVLVFIDERLAGTGKVEEKLFPGSYRIYLQRGERAGRVREALVSADNRRKLALSWKVDVALDVAGEQALLRPGGGPAERGTIEAVRELGRQLGVRAVIVVGVRERRIEGAALMRGELVRRGSVALSGDGKLSPERGRALARYLAYGEVGAGLELGGGDDGGSIVPGALVGAGVSALVAGAALVAIGYADPCDPCGVLEPQEVGFVSLGVGAAAMAAGLYLWKRGDRPEQQIGVIPARGGVGVAWRLEF